MATATSTRFGAVLTGLLFFVGFGLVAISVGLLRIAAAMAVTGAVVGLAISLRRRRSPAALAAGAVLVPVAAIAEAVGIGLVLTRSFDPSALSGAGLLSALILALIMLAVPLSVGVGAMIGGIGLTATLRSEVDGDGLARVIGTALFTMVLLAIVFGASLALRLAMGEAVLDQYLEVADELVKGASGAIGPEDLITGLLMFFVLLTAAGFSGFHALRTVPIAELAPTIYRTSVERAGMALRRLMMWATVIAVFGAIMLAMSAESGGIESALSSDAMVRFIVSALGSESVHWLLVLLTAVFSAVSIAIGLIQWLTGGVTSLLQRVIPTSAGGLLIIGFAGVGSPGAISEIRASLVGFPEPMPTILEVASPADLVLLAAALALAVLILTLVALIATGVMGLVPDRSFGGVLIGSGLGLGAVAIALSRGSPFMVFGVLGLAIMSWDISDRSSRAVADFHRGRGPSFPVEILQWLASAGVAVVGVVAALGLMRVVQGARPIPFTEFTLAALAGVAVCVMLLIGVIRG